MTLSNCLRKSQEIYWQFLQVPFIEMAKCKLVHTAILSPWLNGVITTGFKEEVTSNVKTIVDYFKKSNTPFSWWTETSCEPPHFAKELLKHGAQCHGDFDGMVLSLDELKEIPRSNQLKIQVVSSLASLRSFIDVLIRSYGESNEIAFPVETLFGKPGLNYPIFHFLGKENEVPVTAGSLFIKDDMAGIYHIGTVPEARRKGYASLLMYAALKHAQYHGCKASFLTSTPMANQLYKNLGYKKINDFRLYML